jgi:hypothetical protein
VAYFERIDAFGSLQLAKRNAEEAPKWELYQAWEIDPEQLDKYTRGILKLSAEAHTLGQSMLSRPDHEFVDGQEFISRFNFKRAPIEFKHRRAKILPTAVQKLLAKRTEKI